MSDEPYMPTTQPTQSRQSSGFSTDYLRTVPGILKCIQLVSTIMFATILFESRSKCPTVRNGIRSIISLVKMSPVKIAAIWATYVKMTPVKMAPAPVKKDVTKIVLKRKLIKYFYVLVLPTLCHSYFIIGRPRTVNFYLIFNYGSCHCQRA